MANEDLSGIFSSSVRDSIPPDVLSLIINSMSTSITTVFKAALIGIVIAAVFVYLMGGERIVSGQKKKDQDM